MPFDHLVTKSVELEDIRILLDDPEVFSWFEGLVARMACRAEAKTHAVVPLQLATGPVEVDSLRSASPWVLVVHGDLIASGDLDFGTEPYDTSLLVVLGNVRARHFRFGGSSNCYISGGVTLSGYCFGDHGDEGATLFTPNLSAEALILDGMTDVNTPQLKDLVVCSTEGWGHPLHVDLRNSEDAKIFVPEALKGDSLDNEAAWRVAHAGGKVFLPGVIERLISLDVSPDRCVKPV